MAWPSCCMTCSTVLVFLRGTLGKVTTLSWAKGLSRLRKSCSAVWKYFSLRGPILRIVICMEAKLVYYSCVIMRPLIMIKIR